jgi:hypothetical protein
MINGYFATPADVENYLGSLAASFPNYCQRISLPHPTVGNKTCSALRIGLTPSRGFARGVLFTGGVHGDEKGGAEICVNFAEALLTAYQNGTGLSFRVGSNAPVEATPAQVDDLKYGLEVYVFPLVNPDGRERGTRQNRNGVDLARNFPFLWDHPNVGGSPGPGLHYRGPSGLSEPESQNYVWLVDNFPKITRVIDIHSNGNTAGSMVAYHWGNAPNQTSDSGMNFRKAKFNPTYWATLGKVDPNATPEADYLEFITDSDLNYVRSVSDAAAASMKAVQGTWYSSLEGVRYGLFASNTGGAYTGVGGTPTDYLFSRYYSLSRIRRLIPVASRKVYGWLIEFAPSDGSLSPNPAPADMNKIIQEVNAGMLTVCRKSVFPTWMLKLLSLLPWP